jgi:hypothetical protein
LAVVEAPYEFLGEFLTVEGATLDSWACDELLQIVASVEGARPSRFQKSGNAHAVDITGDGILIKSIYREPPAQCTIPLSQFMSIVEQWRAILAESN